MLLFIGGTEIIFIVIAVLMLFGAKKIPEIARALGKGFREFQNATNEIKREIESVNDINTTEPQKKSTDDNPAE
ncbi:MAG TPA: twin-arginine translocase TatA/TatE family subunit [Tenuifilaceae bacterium]|nr:twin-arginine translocase TatA/TatE family subunit [Tenuifilaceae bacterium]